MYYVALFVAVALAAGCSVKEDREACPCRLVLDFGDVDTAIVKSLNVQAVCEGEVVFGDVVYADDFGAEYVREVPRGVLKINVWSGGDEGYGMVIPYGCECPPIYMGSVMADARGETCREYIDVCKNHCRLTVLVEGMTDVPYSFTFRGNVSGYGSDGSPSYGDFSCVAYPGLTGESQAVLPRQLDSSLLLDVDDGTAATKTFALGEHIAASGYDWTLEDLADMTVVLNYYITYVRIIIQKWDKEFVYDIIL